MATSLDNALSELADACDDFETNGYRGGSSVLARFIDCVDREPLCSLREALLPEVDLRKWWDTCLATKGGMVGSGTMDWPTDRAARVSMQLELCRAICAGTIDLLEVAHGFCYAGTGRYNDDLLEFSSRVLRPLVRDVSRLADLRVSPPVLGAALAVQLPDTGDKTLNELLERSRDQFRDKNPATRRQALEKLWDAWERLKTLDQTGNKQASVTQLLGRAANDAAFLEVLQREAAELTNIGNRFHIRHFETDRTPITADSHVDYLFHRMWAMVWLLLSTRL
jgi:hypothetical protein